jgi:glycosyltransferase involved in cell wall biosynthesis
VRRVGLQSVHFLGFRNQSELPPLYELADILVVPSTSENWGLVVNEAMNAACAVVASDQVGCAVDLVEEGISGAIYPARDTHHLAQVLGMILERGTYREMGHRGASRIAGWGIPEDVRGLAQALARLGAGA